MGPARKKVGYGRDTKKQSMKKHVFAKNDAETRNFILSYGYLKVISIPFLIINLAIILSSSSNLTTVSVKCMNCFKFKVSSIGYVF